MKKPLNIPIILSKFLFKNLIEFSPKLLLTVSPTVLIQKSNFITFKITLKSSLSEFESTLSSNSEKSNEPIAGIRKKIIIRL